jgi:hypothetical protein
LDRQAAFGAGAFWSQHIVLSTHNVISFAKLISRTATWVWALPRLAGDHEATGRDVPSCCWLTRRHHHSRRRHHRILGQGVFRGVR